ncbi:hypothetical protein BBR47_17830 [Brevibacillus brevis NBRC 100599]|uniref:Uncharacterized protein n=1 Tax=Brevibacillus brevis (strain 47 / JCM 6285 / NBRC 100599) TaxID=358681 RepID=C0ZAF1_BREBN|nr:hypothetical protein BBR47_17830 [Brevibacillus brevis NBRC 100599]
MSEKLPRAFTQWAIFYASFLASCKSTCSELLE